jgi:hypothetical protein
VHQKGLLIWSSFCTACRKTIIDAGLIQTSSKRQNMFVGTQEDEDSFCIPPSTFSPQDPK